jgi:hypothetical protein
MRFTLEFNNLKSRENWKLGQKGNFIHMNLYITLTSLENYGHKEDYVLYF